MYVCSDELGIKRNLFYTCKNMLVPILEEKKSLVGQAPKTNIDDTHLTIAIVVHLAQLHIILMAISTPLMICIPDGCLFDSGNLRMVSDGFRANSALSTSLWGSGIAWVTAVRYLGTVHTPLKYALLAHLCVPLATYTAFLTLRYDMLQNLHWAFAAIWIVSSFTLHFCVTLGKWNRDGLSSYVFGFGVSIGVIFLTMYVCIQVGYNETIYTLIHAADVNSTQLLSTVSILEILTVYSLLLLDFLLCSVVLDTYAEGASVLHLVSQIQASVYRVPTQLGIMTFYILLMVLISVCIARVV
jgi:hypothetical protein